MANRGEILTVFTCLTNHPRDRFRGPLAPIVSSHPSITSRENIPTATDRISIGHTISLSSLEWIVEKEKAARRWFERISVNFWWTLMRRYERSSSRLRSRRSAKKGGELIASCNNPSVTCLSNLLSCRYDTLSQKKITNFITNLSLNYYYYYYFSG